MMQLPYKGNFQIGQKFGENFNNHYHQEGMLGHNGIDIPMPNGTPVYSAVNGKVVAISKDIQKGEGVAVLSTDKFDYQGQECFLDTIYWHMKDGSIIVNIGDTIVAGQQLGLSNNTGQTTGPHLHFSVLPTATDGSRRNLAGLANGYRGCIDPIPYLPDPKQKYKDLQTFLNNHGAHLVVDGNFGKLSRQALTDFIG